MKFFLISDEASQDICDSKNKAIENILTLKLSHEKKGIFSLMGSP